MISNLRFGYVPPTKYSELAAIYSFARTPDRVPLFSEIGDTLFERYYRQQTTGDMANILDISVDTKHRLLRAIESKQRSSPSKPNHVEEETEEVVREMPYSKYDVDSVRTILTKYDFTESDFRRLLYLTKMPFVTSEKVMQSAIDKIEGRLACQNAYPDVPYEQRKKIMKGYEEASAKHYLYA